MSHPWAGREDGWVGEEIKYKRKKINHVAGSAAFHWDMLCWNGNGRGLGGGKEQETEQGRGEIPLVLTGRKAKDGEVGSIARKTKGNRARVS